MGSCCWKASSSKGDESDASTDDTHHMVNISCAAKERLDKLRAKKKKDKEDVPGSPMDVYMPAVQSGTVALYAKGFELIYKRTGEAVSVCGVHLGDPDGVYYTVTMPDGREKQTMETALVLPLEHDKCTTAQYSKGQTLLYKETGQNVAIVAAFTMNGDVHYAIKLPGGEQQQVLESLLCLVTVPKLERKDSDFEESMDVQRLMEEIYEEDDVVHT